ncbi:hypothetical protein B0H13DRAFT_1871042 [Mycena leptocephala]|nr:hypothetical protein B0H13DRAFT_1871042 [Mycena leptocephala]
MTPDTCTVPTVPASLLLPLLLQDSDTTIDSQNSLVLECDTDLLKYFDELAENDCLPTLDDLLEHASVIRERYAYQTAYEQSLDKTDHDSAPSRTKVPQGSIWTPPTARKAPTAEHDDDADMPGLDEIPDDDEPTPREPEPNGDAKSPSVQHSRWLRALNPEMQSSDVDNAVFQATATTLGGFGQVTGHSFKFLPPCRIKTVAKPEPK